jgi:hypothetical protein
MAYSAQAAARRRCMATRADGEPCRAWALWDDPEQRCVMHAGRGHRGPLAPGFAPSVHARYRPCRCVAYNWPHRPGGGLCRWPEEPRYRSTIPAGTRAY